MLTWIYILSHAAYEPTQKLYGGRVITLNPGQCVLTLKELAEVSQVSIETIRRILVGYETEKQIEKRSSNANTLITVLNWTKYQENEKPFEKPLRNGCETDEKPTYLRKNLRREEGKKQTFLPDQVNANVEAADQHAGRVQRCMMYYQSAIHLFYSATEKEAVEQLADEYPEQDFKAAVDKAKENGVRNTTAWRYIGKILDTGGVKDFSNKHKKNDAEAGYNEAKKILESGELDELF